MLNEQEHSLQIAFPVPNVASVGTLLGETFRTFFRNLGFISALILVVWVPLEFIKNYLIYQSGLQENVASIVRADMFLEGVFGSLTAPALIYGLVKKFQTGQNPSIRQCYQWGFRFWGKVFVNRLLSGLAILGGIVLLVVPGIVFSVWFVLVDQVVAIEGDTQNRVLTRSKQLTEGYRWMLFLSGLSVLGIFFFAGMISIIFLAFFDYWYVSAIIDSALDVVDRIFTIMLLLFYLNRVSESQQPTSQ
jgi:formate hydrogenlyase subunit 3/multisubunit Na+/H+ antiporter MnhD subunit